MTVLLEATKLPPEERIAAVLDMLELYELPMNVEYHCPDDQIDDVWEYWQLGGPHIIKCVSPARTLSRSQWQVDQSEPRSQMISLGIRLSGKAASAQAGCLITHAARDLMLRDHTRPFEYDELEAGESLAFSITLDQLGLPVDTVRQAVPVLGGSPVYRLVQAHMLRLSQSAANDKLTATTASMVGNATTELLRALIVSAVTSDRRTELTWHDSLRTRIIAYARENITDPGLCADKIAAYHNVSVRQLYKVWSCNQVGLAQWITNERLEGARRELAAPNPEGSSVTAVAYRWGFADSTHFSRRFRQAYGLTPREWRRLH